MWTTIANGFKALLDHSPITLVLGVMVIGMSVVDVFIAKKNWKERTVKIAAAVISLALLFTQARSSTRAAAQEATRLQDALNKQRDQLTSAFIAGTNQVIKATSETANQTQRSAKQQTDAIKQQATEQFGQVQGAIVGTPTCPHVVGNITRPSGRPHALVVINHDGKLNMYDLVMELTEFGPAEPGAPWSSILQQRVINLPLVIPDRARVVPFEFLSKMTDIDVQIILSTRATTCSGRIGLYDTGNNVWVNDHSIMNRQDGTVVDEQNLKLSQGLANSKADPQ
jgi:hypothetical protein